MGGKRRSIQKGGVIMIYELRTYTLYPGRVPEFLETVENGLPVREKYSKLGGLESKILIPADFSPIK